MSDRIKFDRFLSDEEESVLSNLGVETPMSVGDEDSGATISYGDLAHDCNIDIMTLRRILKRLAVRGIVTKYDDFYWLTNKGMLYQEATMNFDNVRNVIYPRGEESSYYPKTDKYNNYVLSRDGITPDSVEIFQGTGRHGETYSVEDLVREVKKGKKS
jgi:predicted transcriptional regulator